MTVGDWFPPDRDSAVEDSWAKVERIANGVTDYGLAKAVRTYYSFYLPVGVILLIAIGAFLAILTFRIGLDEWPFYLGFGMSIAALGALAGGLLYTRKLP